MDYGKYFYAVVSRIEKYMPDLPDRLEIGGYERYLERAIRIDVFMQD